MNWRNQCAAVIPCLNEESAIASVVAKVAAHVATVLVIDDGSTDRTANFARRAGAEILTHHQAKGKGAALRTGWAEARRRGFAWAITLDGDGQHSPNDIPAFFHCAERGGASLIVGNRMLDARQMPWLRRRVNLWMSRRLAEAAGMALPDSQCGFRLLSLEAWAALPLVTQHFEIESETLVAFIAAGFKIEFIPIEVIYKQGRSKIHPLLDTVRWFGWWRRWRRSVAAPSIPPPSTSL